MASASFAHAEAVRRRSSGQRLSLMETDVNHCARIDRSGEEFAIVCDEKKC
jgi:hypothetical protein